MGSCQGLVRVSGPCTSVCCESHMAHNTALNFFPFSFCFDFLLYQASVSDSFLPLFFSFSHLFGIFGARLSIIIQTFSAISAISLLSLVHIQSSPDSFALLALLGVHVAALLLSFTSFFRPIRLARHFVPYSIFLFLLVSFRFASSLLSHHCLCSYTCARFLSSLLCYGTSSSPLSVLEYMSLCSLFVFLFFTYDQLHYHGSTIQTSAPLFTARYHVCYCFCVWNRYR
jgi:hypothetical protein